MHYKGSDFDHIRGLDFYVEYLLDRPNLELFAPQRTCSFSRLTLDETNDKSVQQPLRGHRKLTGHRFQCNTGTKERNPDVFHVNTHCCIPFSKPGRWICCRANGSLFCQFLAYSPVSCIISMSVLCIHIFCCWAECISVSGSSLCGLLCACSYLHANYGLASATESSSAWL